MSNDIKCITNDYFTVNSVVCFPDDHNIVFNNFKTANNEFTLSLTAGNTLLVENLVFFCSTNKVKFPVINCLENVKCLAIYSAFPDNVSFPVNNVSSDILDKCYLNNESMWLSDRLDMK